MTDPGGEGAFKPLADGIYNASLSDVNDFAYVTGGLGRPSAWMAARGRVSRPTRVRCRLACRKREGGATLGVKMSRCRGPSRTILVAVAIAGAAACGRGAGRPAEPAGTSPPISTRRGRPRGAAGWAVVRPLLGGPRLDGQRGNRRGGRRRRRVGAALPLHRGTGPSARRASRKRRPCQSSRECSGRSRCRSAVPAWLDDGNHWKRRRPFNRVLPPHL